MAGNRDFDNTNRGTLWKNKDKVESNPNYNEKWPDMKGKINIDGVEHWLDAWFFDYEDRDTGKQRRAINVKIGDECREQRGTGRGGSNTRGRSDEGRAARRDDRPARRDERDDPRDGGRGRREGGRFEEMDDDIPF